MGSNSHWEHFEHEADIGIRGIGGSREVAFAQAALAMTAVITNPDKVAPRYAVAIHCEAPDDELLLVDWLNALIYEMATRRMLFTGFELQMKDTYREATAWGEPLVREKHHPAVEIKGATYTGLKVGRQADGNWYAQCVVDV